MTALAVVFTYLPGEERTYNTPFSGADYEDPLSAAHAFMESEQERDDFPGSLWAVTGNDEAGEIRSAKLMEAIFGMPEDEAREAAANASERNQGPE